MEVGQVGVAADVAGRAYGAERNVIRAPPCTYHQRLSVDSIKGGARLAGPPAAGRARVLVPVPGPADVLGLLDEQHGVDA